jgi:Ca2+-transporting ATPase
MQRQLREVGSRLIGVSGIACAGVFVVGLLRGYSAMEMVKTSISLAIAALPEGLPAVATTTLARGVRQLEAQGILVRRLDAIETLASVQTICLDKTGTLTRNQQTVTRIVAGDQSYQIRDDRPAPLRQPDVARLLEVAVLCNEVRFPASGDALDGSSTERALVQTALDAGFDVAGLRARFPLEHLRQRSEQRNRMVSLHRMPEGGFLVAVKGRPNEVLARCCSMLKDGKIIPLNEKEHDAICTQNEVLAEDALRVLGFAFREVLTPEQTDDEELIWAGLMGMEDPLRPGAEELITRFHRAGMRTVMITGDQSATAHAIGRTLDLSAGSRLKTLDATQLEELAPEALHRIAHNVHVFSRVSPSHKLQIIRALQADGGVVAMTGDGINDGPALKAADIGIAIGAKELARDVADMVLIDDDLAKILHAVAQGRAISDDIRKSVSYLVATNMTEVFLSFFSLLLGFGQPLSAMQLLWINLVSDIFPELALALEPPEGDVLERPPKRTGEPIIAPEEFARLGADASWITAGALTSLGYGLARYGRSRQANTLAFCSLVTGQLFHTWSARSRQHSIFDSLFRARRSTALAPNPAVSLAVGAGFALEAIAALVPGIRRAVGTTPLGWLDWCVSTVGGIAPFLMNEARKAAVSGEPHFMVPIGDEARKFSRQDASDDHGTPARGASGRLVQSV